ncbi:hypothetical protein ACINK0_15005 [Deinococcus sp. VB343]|uniref:DUF4139 domain-containing protein n=1 Tax=Deinococcus sp. VB142 TaxID=3112952 RepID=A0AAU6Q7H2_9DEIO
MNRNIAALLLTLLPSVAFATDLRVYPSFTEVQQPAAAEVTFPFGAWRWIQPGSFTVSGAIPAAISLQPAELDWLRTQEGKSVTWVQPGQAPVQATFERADDLLIKLSSGEYVNAGRAELAFSEKPPLQGGVTVKVAGLDTTKSANLLYRTGALFWKPRYELTLNGTSASLSALAQISNLSDQPFNAQKVDLYGGSVQQQYQPTLTPVAYAETTSVAGRTSSGVLAMAASSPIANDQIRSVGEVRGLQRYSLPGGLTIGRGETRTLPFLQPKVSDFTRYASVQSYFNGQGGAGSTNRHYKFTSSQSLPTGLVDVREAGLLVGSVQLPAVQAGKPVDLDLGADTELRFEKTVKRTGQEKNEKGQVLSTSYQVTYSFTSTKQTATKVSVREQLYARSVSVDGQAAQNGQITITRQVDVPAGGKASLSFKLKVVN